MVNSPTDIRAFALNDYVTFSAPLILNSPTLIVKDFDYNIIVSERPPVNLSNSYLWRFKLDATLGFEIQKHYIVEITDDITPEYEDRYFIYINNETTFVFLLKRIYGLAGHNIRRHDYVYTRGNVSEYKISIYSNSGALATAKAGGVDVPMARYKITALYDNRFNRYETRVEREL